MAQANLKPICASCDSAKECGFAKTTGQLVLDCDKQRGFQGLYLVTNGGRPTDMTLVSGREAVRTAAPGDCVGLCVNCDSRDTCAFPKPPGGIWHCEEYC